MEQSQDIECVFKTLCTYSFGTIRILLIDEFDYYIDISFVLGAVNDENKRRITTNPLQETMQMRNIITNKYVGDETQITYSDLLIDIESIEHTQIQKIDQGTNIEWTNKDDLNLDSRIQCTEFGCASIKQKSQKGNDFADSVQYTLREHFSNDLLRFSVADGSQSLEIIDKNVAPMENETKYVSYGMCGIVGFLVFIAMCAFLWNKGVCAKCSIPGFNIVDDAEWAAVLIFTLQFWDFYSDVNLTVEMWNHEDRDDNMLLLISAIGATFFVIVPYIANLVIAANIKHIIRRNQAAKGWFQYHTPVFALLVVVTGGSFPALALVSSAAGICVCVVL